MNNADALTEKFEALIDFVRQASDSEAIQSMDVSDLGLKAAHLCEAVEGAPPETARAIKPLMAQLIQDLDALAMKLEKQKKAE